MNLAKKPHRLGLLDGDAILFRVLAGTEVEVELDKDWWSLTNDLSEARRRVMSRINVLANLLEIKQFVMCFSGSNNFRMTIAKDYKGSRRNKRKPVGYAPFVNEWMAYTAKERLITNKWTLHSVMKEGIEADDLMGIMATTKSTPHLNRQTVIISDDKDMLTIPGLVFRKPPEFFQADLVEEDQGDEIDDEDGGPRVLMNVTPEQAEFNHMLQTLAGDTADEYPGCPGIGLKGAFELLGADPLLAYRMMPEGFYCRKEKDHRDNEFDRCELKSGEPCKCAVKQPHWSLIEPATSYWQTVVSTFRACGLTRDDAITQARLARILHAEDWDAKNNVPILWDPPSEGEQ
jgi:5'-3' exonuclease